MKFFYVWTDRQSIIKTDRLTDRPHQLILRSSLPDLRNIFCFFTSILTVFVSIAEVISSSLAYSMFCSYWTHLGPTSLLESLGAEIVRILDLVTHSNNFDFLDKIQNLSEYIFRGDSLSRNHFFTHSLTHWQKLKKYQKGQPSSKFLISISHYFRFIISNIILDHQILLFSVFRGGSTKEQYWGIC